MQNESENVDLSNCFIEARVQVGIITSLVSVCTELWSFLIHSLALHVSAHSYIPLITVQELYPLVAEHCLLIFKAQQPGDA